MTTMFGQLVQRLQALSPVTSPLTSPVNSPKTGRRKGHAKNPAARRSLRLEYREIQSEPEDAPAPKPRSKRKIEKLRAARTRAPICELPLQGSVSMGRLDGIKQVHRLSQYEQYFEALLNEEQRLDHEEIANAKAKVKQLLKRGQEESDLERIQDLFPNDCLRLYDRDAVTMRMKGLMRKRSGAAARLQRALSAKSLRSESPPRHPTNNNQHQEKRQFIMETPVQFTAGVTSQDRHLFLFNDLLLIAKARSGGNFKLKEKVRVSEIWMTKSGIDVVSEIPKSQDISFVLGWPTTNVVATFTTQAARDLWWNKLSEMVNIEKSKEPCTTNIQVTYFDQATSIEYCKTFSIGPEETARSCIKQALEHLEMRGCEAGGYQLWAKTGRDESPYPLVGHERPFAIKLSCLRDNLASEDPADLDHCNNIHDPLARCQFILRSASKAVESEKKTNKKVGGKIRIGQVFRRSISKDNTGCLFGLPLSRICEGDNLPRPVMAMLQQVFTKGPFTQGIFRKSANARLVRELREKLDLGETVSLEHVPVLVTAALLKEFLRSLPDPLLGANLYPQWRAALDTPNINHRIIRLKRVLEQLPKPNLTLLNHFLCVLFRVSRRASQNLMSAANLGVCVGPSLLWSDSAVGADDLRAVPLLVENLVTHCEHLVPQLAQLMGDHRDSGTEESDSMRRDDSSIDSLECSPPPRKDKISLSRDSGLTMSDTQLYTPDEEESGSTSSSGYDPAFDPHTKVTPSLSVPPEYVRVYGGWEERLNPNFQRQAWFRQRSRRLNCAPPVKQEVSQVRRSASEESLLDGPPTPPRRNKPELRTDGKQVIVSADAIRPNNFKSELSIKPVFDELFKRHPPLRKVTAVHCEVISEPRRHQYRETQPIYANTKKEKQLNETKKDNFPRPIERTPEIYYSPKQSFSPQYTPRLDSSESSLYASCVSELTPPPPPPPKTIESGGDYYRSREDCDDSSTLSDDDWTPHVSRSNSRGNEVTPKLRHLPPVHVEAGPYLRGRLKNKEERPAHRSRSLPPPPSFSAKSSIASRRAPITSYYLGDCNQTHYVVTRSYRDEESYV